MLVTDGLVDRVTDFRYAHFDNDYYQRDAADGHHLSDHDPPVVDARPARRAGEHRAAERQRHAEVQEHADRHARDVDASTRATIAYADQWVRLHAAPRRRRASPITGATALTYTVQKEDRGSALRLRGDRDL